MSRSDGLVRDRDGDLTSHSTAPVCDRDDCNGWAGEDYLGRPVPCRVHRADLVHRLTRQRRRNYTTTR
jgi:hypothetical protein